MLTKDNVAVGLRVLNHKELRGNMVNLRELKASLECLQRESAAFAGKRDHIVIEQTPDALDQTQSAAQRDLAVSLLNRGAIAYRQVERALRRIEEGTFGVCLACDEPISAKRLQAVPWAELCLHCQSRLDAQNRGLCGADYNAHEVFRSVHAHDAESV
jgi:DnaK suppressor protein